MGISQREYKDLPPAVKELLRGLGIRMEDIAPEMSFGWSSIGEVHLAAGALVATVGQVFSNPPIMLPQLREADQGYLAIYDRLMIQASDDAAPGNDPTVPDLFRIATHGSIRLDGDNVSPVYVPLQNGFAPAVHRGGIDPMIGRTVLPSWAIWTNDGNDAQKRIIRYDGFSTTAATIPTIVNATLSANTSLLVSIRGYFLPSALLDGTKFRSPQSLVLGQSQGNMLFRGLN